MQAVTPWLVVCAHSHLVEYAYDAHTTAEPHAERARPVRVATSKEGHRHVPASTDKMARLGTRWLVLPCPNFPWQALAAPPPFPSPANHMTATATIYHPHAR